MKYAIKIIGDTKQKVYLSIASYLQIVNLPSSDALQ